MDERWNHTKVGLSKGFFTLSVYRGRANHLFQGSASRTEPLEKGSFRPNVFQKPQIARKLLSIFLTCYHTYLTNSFKTNIELIVEIVDKSSQQLPVGQCGANWALSIWDGSELGKNVHDHFDPKTGWMNEWLVMTRGFSSTVIRMGLLWILKRQLGKALKNVP